MLNSEQMFDKDSFTDEIKNASEAEMAYVYFTHNLTDFRSQLENSGKSYEDVAEAVRQCWTNLLAASKRVGYTNAHLQRMAQWYSK